MAGEAPELRPGHLRQWLAEWPDGKLSLYMLLLAGLIGALLYALDRILFG